MDENDTAIAQPYPPPAGPPFAGPAFAGPAVGSAQFAAPPGKTRWRDIIFGWRSAAALFAAGIVMGGLGGAALTVILDHSNDGPTISRFPGGSTFAPGFGGPYGGAQPGGQSGQSGQTGQSSQGSGSTGFLV